MRLRERLGVDEQRFRQLTHLMELALVGMFFVGLERGDTGILVNTAVALAVTQLVPILERDIGIPMDPALTLWITAAVFLHALGTVGIPGTALESFYRQVPGWDHMTHALSASVVAAAGYATARAVDLHSEEVYLPPRFMFVFILLLTVAFGVLWEVIEFTIVEVAAVLGGAPVLVQFGLADTLLDLVFNTIGAAVVATWGTAYLSGVVGALRKRLEGRAG